MKKIVYIVLGVLVLGGAVFLAVNSRNKSVDNKQYGILNPNPNEPLQFPQDNQEQKPEEKPEQKPQEQKPEPKPAPRGESPKPTPKPKVLGTSTTTTTTKVVTNTTNTYRVAELNLEILAPAAWQLKLEEGKGNIVAFYSGNQQLGQIEVFVGTNQSFESLRAELAANTNISNLQQITVNGIPAFKFNDKRYGNQVNYALIRNNNVYYLRGVFIQEQYFKNVHF